MAKLLAPNGKPSNLSPEQYRLVRTPEFKEWFGDWENSPETASKVIDEETKEPLVVYHGYLVGGGAGKEFYEFQNLPAFFSKTKEFAYQYASTKSMDAGLDSDIYVYACFLNIKKLFDAKNKSNIELAKEQLPENIKVHHGTAWFLSAEIPKEELIEEMQGIITIPKNEMAEDILSSNIGDIIKEKVSASQYENQILLYKDEDWAYITDAQRFDEIVYKEIAEWVNNDYEKTIKYKGKYLKTLILNEDTYKYELNKDPLFLEFQNEVENRKKYYTENILKLLNKSHNSIITIKDKTGYPMNFYVRKINLKTYKTTTKNNWTMYENETIQKFLIDNNFGGWYAFEKGDKTFGVYDNKNIKLADGTNTTFDGSNPDIRFDEGGSVMINPTEIECHKCHWKWKVKDGGEDLFICHKCYTDNSKFYKFEGLEGQKILDTISYAKGGRTIAQTPAPKKDQIKGSDKNKEGSSKDLKSAKKIELSDKTIEAIKNKVDGHNEKHPNKKITIDSVKAVVRRGMGAYSSSHRPTIKGGNPNSRVAWGLARLNAFLYKIVNGKSKSGKYSQDNDLIEELGYKVQKYADGGDIQAYEDAIGISEFEDGGETKPKKVYVSIKLPNKLEYVNNEKGLWGGDRFSKYDEQPFEELKNGVLQGLVGVSSSPNNIAEWFIHRDCLIVMDYEQFIAINETETIDYYDSYQLMKNNLFLFRRLYANVSRYGEQEDAIIQTLKKILEKIIPEIDLEMNLSEGQKYMELYRISRFLSPYETSAFPRWIEKNEIKIESPIDLTNAILDFNKLNDNWLGQGFQTPVLTFDELLPIIEKGVVRAGSIYDSEQEIVLINRKLNIPKNSQLFFVGKDEVGRKRESNLDEFIEKYNLKELYKIYFVDRQEIEKYRGFWVKKEEEKFKQKLEKGREDLELKKEQVLDELLNYFLQKSISYVKNELEKEYLEYYESLDFYDETDDDSIEQNLFSIPLVESIMNTYEFIVKNFWKAFIQKKRVENLDLYAFMRFYSDVESELKRYFENNKDELEKLYNYRNTRGSGSIDAYRFERLLLKTINDYENLPELTSYKELAKMYLDKMGREIYRYYDKNNLKLVSQYKNGGETDEPTEFWGTEAGGVLVYCSTTDRYLILLRSDWVLEPNTWGIISGKLDDDETNIEDAVLRESQEETGHKLGDLIPSFIFEKPNFKFHNFVSIVEEEFIPKLNWENDDYRWVKINEMPENLHFGLKLLLEKDNIPQLVEKNKNNTMNRNNPKDTITMDIPLLIRFAELMREDIKTDVALHEVVENLLEIKDKGVLTMGDYESIVGNVTGLEEDKVEEPKMEEGGKVPSIHSQKGDIKISLDDNWYSDDSSVELVPVSELMKFREFDRKVTPKYNQDNSRDNINHLKFMFQKEGVKSPIIIEYSPEDNVVLIIEGNHRLNSAIDLGMEYLPARVVLRKYGKYTPAKIKNAMQVNGIKANQDNYIPSDLKPSQVGIMGAKPIAYAEGGIIEGRLHSECGDDGCGRKFQVGENGHIIEAERDEAVIVADAFNDNKQMTIEGTPSEIASALNVIGGGKNFDKGAKIIENGKPKELPEMKQEATDTDVDDIIDSGSIIINRRSMADEKSYKVTGSAKQIASAINSINGNGVVIEQGAKIE